jgi:hypothetical protein
MTTPHALDAAAIQALVAEVVRRIQAAHAMQATPATPARPASVAASAPAATPAPAAFSIPDRVVTLAHLERLPAAIREVVVDAKAVITPSAREHANDAGITLVRGGTTATAAAPARPFIVAQAACRGDVSARTAAIVRTLPGSQQLPASGLADVIAAFAGHASRDAARGVLLTGRPAVAVILANRSASLRAVTARDAATLVAAAADTAANLLVVDPSQFTGGSLERLCADFHRAASGPLPAELAAAPAGCGCKSHSH